jgi:hypothetical protein
MAKAGPAKELGTSLATMDGQVTVSVNKALLLRISGSHGRRIRRWLFSGL